MRFAEKALIGEGELNQKKAEELVKTAFLLLAEKYGASKITLEAGEYGSSKIYSDKYIELGLNLKSLSSHTAIYDIATGKLSVIEGFPKGTGKGNEWQVGEGRGKFILGEPTWGIYFSGDENGVKKSAEFWESGTKIVAAPLIRENETGTSFMPSKGQNGNGPRFAYFAIVKEAQ